MLELRGHPSPRALSVLLLATLAAAPAPTKEPPTLILFGGAWGPEGNQASIELHLDALIQALGARKPTILYGGPTRDARIVQVQDDLDDPDGRALALVLDKRTGFSVGYRPTKVKAHKPATADELEKAVRDADPKKSLILFGVGHGNRTKKGDAEESTLSMWGTEEADAIDQSEVSSWLLKRAAATVLVLGQCHSGGFVDISFRGKGHRTVQDPTRCVLAAVPRDRAASGCTSDLESPDARAFMSLIAEALGSSKADLDGDGRVDLSEAFAMARVEDRTVNVPVRSSEVWLRQLVGSKAGRLGRLDLDELERMEKKVRGMSRKDELFVLRALSKQTGVKSFKEAEAAFNALLKKIDEGNKTIDVRVRAAGDLRARLQDALYERWPELTNPYHPISRRLLHEQVGRIASFLRSLPGYDELQAAEAEILRRDRAIESLEREAALIERWLRAAENLAFEKIVRTRRPKPDRKALDALLECESIAPL